MANFKVGDKIVVVGGDYKDRGKQGVVTEVGGTCAGEPAVVVALKGKRVTRVTFFPQSQLVKVAG